MDGDVWPVLGKGMVGDQPLRPSREIQQMSRISRRDMPSSLPVIRGEARGVRAGGRAGHLLWGFPGTSAAAGVDSWELDRKKYLGRAEVVLAEPLGKGTGQRVSGDSPSLWIEGTTF